MASRSGAAAKKSGNYQTTRFNALKHGVLSSVTVLPWEDVEEYEDLLNGLATEHQPQGATQEHLVEEIAGVIWRKRRLRLGEAASLHAGLKRSAKPWSNTAESATVLSGFGGAFESVDEVLRKNPAVLEIELVRLSDERDKCHKAIGLLSEGRRGAYERALHELPASRRQEWEEKTAKSNSTEASPNVPGNQTFFPNCDGLLAFLEGPVKDGQLITQIKLIQRPQIGSQAFGEAFDPESMEPLARHEVHLDRKLERTLSMLLRLKELDHTGPSEP